jgi:molecular chaperone HscB
MQSVDLSSNYFALFDLPVSFDVDQKQLVEQYRSLQRTAHPDKFANATDTERRLSMQMATHINEGYQVLKDPLKRGRYLLELQGVELDDTSTAIDDTFLMEQIELRERLGDVKGSDDPHQQLQKIKIDIDARAGEIVRNMASLFIKNNIEALNQARDLTRKLQFFRRLNEEAGVLEDELSDY